MAEGGTRRKLAVLAWDVGHNPLGRAHLLADLMRDRFDVEIWGSRFRRYGTEIWPPLRHGDIPIRVVGGRQFPQQLAVMEGAARQIDADVLWASKPRLPSFGLAAMAKDVSNRPLVLDVDDHELAFFGTDRPLGLDRLHARWRRVDLRTPFERSWTRVCAGLVGAADEVTTSNPALQERFGGLLVPHARDEARFDPDLYDREQTRERLGLAPDDRLLLFGGTPRDHKGVSAVLEALEDLGDARLRLGVFSGGDLDGHRVPERLRRWVLPLAPPAFADLAPVVGAADLACVLQDPRHPVSRYQMPAKVTDALAMSVPCLVSDVPPLRDLVERDVVSCDDGRTPLGDQILEILEGGRVTEARSRRGRDLFLDTYSYGAVRPEVTALFERLVDSGPAPVHPDLARLTATLRRLYPDAQPPPPPRDPQRSRLTRRRGSEYDLVMFWKQNDSGIYGRRQDMLLSQFERSGRFRTIVHLDRPITPEALVLLAGASARRNDQSRLVLSQTLRRLPRRRRRSRVVRRTFVYGGRRTSQLGIPPRERYVDFVASVMRRHLEGDRPMVFWAHPSDPDFPDVVDALEPDLVVADVVDDSRSWHPEGSTERDLADRNLEEIVRRSDVVLANCEPVADRVRSLTDRVHLVPNGCDLREGPDARRRPRALRRLRGPIIGYAGNLSSRLDVGLLDEVAVRRPGWNLVLVGSTHLDRAVLRLDAHPNVHFLGVRPYEETRRLVQHFDVGIIPHLDDDMTRAMNPLKAFVYAAAGVPIVSTPVSNLDELSGGVAVAAGVDAFLEAIEAALGGGRPAPDLAELDRHSWDRRAAAVIDLIDEAMGVTTEAATTTDDG